MPPPRPDAALIIKLVEDGVSLASISRASGISIDDLKQLPVQRRSVIATNEELGGMAAQLAYRALEEGMRMLDEGNETLRIRLITSLATVPMRRMQTDQSKQLSAMQGLLDTILLGDDPDDEEDDTEEDQGDDPPDD